MIAERLLPWLVTRIGRKTFYMESLDAHPKGEYSATVRDECPLDTGANLVSSELTDGMHAPAIDLDYAAYLLPSSTPGHFHLYIEQSLTWNQYESLLQGFLNAGLIQERWYLTAMEASRSYLRLPDVKKGDNP